MVRSDNILDLESADEDQIDLFYLVDCVLDEIAQGKVTNNKDPDIDDNDDDIMPAASLDFYTPDLMDHIESPLAHYESDQSYSSHESSFQSHRSFHQSLQSPTVPQINIADDLIQQGEIAYEYMAYPDKKGNVNYLWSSKTKSSMSPEHFSVSNKDVIIPEDFNASIYYDQKVGSPASYSNTGNDNVSIPKASHQNEYQSGGVDLSKDFPKAFPNLQHYTDIVNTNDMASQGNNQLSPQTVSPSYSKPNIVQSHEFYDEESNDTSTSEFVSWTCKHPENWSATEVLDWLYYSAEKNGVDCSLLRGESFRTVTGEVLCSMGPDDFLSLEPHYGQFFYKLFRQLVDGLRFTLATETHFVDQPEVEPPMIYTDSQTQRYGNDVASIKLSQGYPHSNDLSQDQSSAHPSLEGYQQYQQNKESYNFEFAPSSLSQNQSTVESLLMQGYDYNTSTHDLKYEHMYGYEYQTEGYPMPQRENYRRTQSDVTSTRAKYADGVTPARRRPGRPRIKSDPTEEELRAQREKKLKSQHLWEFIFDILNNPAYNPSILKWENQNEGVFRFIQSESVAQLWGTLKNNENMTYEKLSRAMRHYYKRGILERVEGRRLVYKFSMVTLDKMREKRLLAGRQLGQ